MYIKHNSYQLKYIKPLEISLDENINNSNYFYHGTQALIPFQRFDKKMDGSGIVSSGNKKYGGFFFTSEKENAEFYTEWFICKVLIKNVSENTTGSNHSSTVLAKANEDSKNYLITDVMDGAMYSDIVVVPYSNLLDIKIIDWEFVGDEESYFESLDKIFGSEIDEDELYDDEGNEMELVSVTKYSIEELIEVTGGDLDYLLSIPIFKKYYDSK